MSKELYPDIPSKNMGYLRGLSVNASSKYISMILNSVTTMKMVNKRFLYAPSDNGFWFNSLIKSVPPIFAPNGF